VSFNILLTGVGGQGLMSLATIIGEACVSSGIKVVTQEQHGLAQRSGSISAHVRIGEAYSPMIPYGSGDLIIAMEAMETLRNIEYLKPGGAIVMSSRLMHPVIETNKIVTRKRENLEYITLDVIVNKLHQVTNDIHIIDAKQLSQEAGNPRTENTVLLGAASRIEGFPLSSEQVLDAIRENVPKRTIDENLIAFKLGSQAF
jgi:indolepyruvate ferredoxin oxidoreductase beta subunit